MARLDLQELAARVSDGEPVNWLEVERQSSSAEETRIVRNLRLVQSLSPGEHDDDAAQIPQRMSTTLLESFRDAGGAGGIDLSCWGKLKLREKIGQGAFGTVYRASDPALDRDVALKLVRPPAGDSTGLDSRVLEEGKVLARVIHPNVVTVYGAETHDGVVGLWMEFVRGRSLAELVEQQGKLGPREAVLVGIDLCQALAAVHEAGLVHRDIKAQNVMREEGGRLVLMDFGAAYDLRNLEAHGDSISGTPLYIAPEIFERKDATTRSDIYSMGVLLYHLVTRSFPVEAHSLTELRERHARAEGRLLRDARPDLPDGFVKVVQRAIHHNPRERYATAGEMEQALSACLGIDSADSIRTAPAPDRRRRNSWIVFGVMAVSLLALAAILYSRFNGPAEAEGPQGPVLTQAQPAPTAVPTETIDPGAEIDTTPARDKDAERPAQPPAKTAQTNDLVSAPAKYAIEASLYRLDENDRRRRLDSGDRLLLDDRLFFEVQVSRSVYLYVINRDQEGHGFALFPLKELDLQNPVPAGERLRIPGKIDGKEQWWAVNTPGGQEDIMILASPQRQIEFETEMQSLAYPSGQARDWGEVPVRGIGALREGYLDDSPSGSAARLFDMAESIAGGNLEQVEGVWFKKIELFNPEP